MKPHTQREMYTNHNLQKKKTANTVKELGGKKSGITAQWWLHNANYTKIMQHTCT